MQRRLNLLGNCKRGDCHDNNYSTRGFPKDKKSRQEQDALFVPGYASRLRWSGIALTWVEEHVGSWGPCLTGQCMTMTCIFQSPVSLQICAFCRFSHLSPLWWRLAKWKRCLAAWQVQGMICDTVPLDLLFKQRHWMTSCFFSYSMCWYAQAAWKHQNKQGTPTFCLYWVVSDISHVNGKNVSQPSCKVTKVILVARGEHIEWTTMKHHYGSTLVSSPGRPWTRLGFSRVLMIPILPSLLQREAGSCPLILAPQHPTTIYNPAWLKTVWNV